MFDAILKATNSSFQKGMTFCRSIYVKKVMKLLAFIFEQSSYDVASGSEIPAGIKWINHYWYIAPQMEHSFSFLKFYMKVSSP